jgi:glycosidase
VDEHLGGPEGLATARRELARRGLKLIVDFVPNHVAPDHPWVLSHPEYFIQGAPEDLQREPASFMEAGDRVLACGRDPYFPPGRTCCS